MDIKTLCLGILTMGEASGYEIKQVFEDAFSHFYVAGFGSIYPALAGLAKEGYVTVSSIEQEKRPAKKVYRLTDSGREAFNAALMETYPHHRVRSEFLTLMVFAHLLPGEQLKKVFDTRLADIERQMAEIEGYLDELKCECEIPPGARFAGGFGVAVLKAAQDFIVQHKDELEQQLQEQKEKLS
jgi:PadR family transcriptional regulator, regulatory protein AphA